MDGDQGRADIWPRLQLGLIPRILWEESACRFKFKLPGTEVKPRFTLLGPSLESHPPFTTAKRTKHFPRAGLNPVLLPTPCCSLSGGGGKYYCSCKAALLPTTSPEPPAQPASAGCFCGRLLSALSPWESGCLSAFSPGGGYARSIQHPLSAGLFLSLY